jgi:SAM-dependent methyltransferase
LARYRWACRFAAEARVLDAACGTGYGADMLAREGRAASVDGFDIAADAVEAARSRFASDRVSFTVGDALRLPVADDAYDLYTSFETIEHLPDDESYLAEAVRVLRPDGTFLCSTPNRLLMHPGATLDDKPLNPFHVREYGLEEFAERLHRYFARVEWFGQSRFAPAYTGGLRAVGSLTSTLAARLHQAYKLAGHAWRRASVHDVTPLAPAECAEMLVVRCLEPRKSRTSIDSNSAVPSGRSAPVPAPV